MRNGSTKYGLPAIGAAVAVCLVCACCSAALLYQYGDALLGVTTTTDTPLEPGTVIVPADTSNLPEWTIIVYSAADDDILEEDLLLDINEMELVGSNPQMNIIVQVDRAEGAFTEIGRASC